MADEASDTVGGGTKNYLGAVGFTSVLVGGEELGRKLLTGSSTSPWWLSIALLLLGYPIFIAPAIWNRFRKPGSEAQVQYLSHEDEELGSAIRAMAWFSAWGKWYAAQTLAGDPKGTGDRREEQSMQTAASLVGYALVDGQLEARGRKPGQSSYEDIPRTHWRASGLHMIRDYRTIWKMILIPTGGAQIAPDGTVTATDPAAKARTDKLAEYDSIIVPARQFESLWPRRDVATDRATKTFLKRAAAGGAPVEEIEKLRPPRSAFLPSRNFAITVIGALVVLLGVGVYQSWPAHKPPPAIPQRKTDSSRLPENSSRMEVWREEAGRSRDDKHLAVNIYVMNGGKTVAEQFSQMNMTLIPHGNPPTALAITGAFTYLHSQIGALTVPGSDTESAPGQKNIWFTVDGPLATKESRSDIKYALALMRYRDTTIPAGKFIYTEICVRWVNSEVIQFCESGHNRSYVAD